MIDRDGKDKTSTFFRDVNRFGDTTLLENQAYLPLGFLAESQLKDVLFEASDGSFSFQNQLFWAATGLEGSVWCPIADVKILGNGVTITENDGTSWCSYKDSTSHSNITYTYTVPMDGFVCLHLDLPKRNDYYVSVNGLELYQESISLPQMIAVGDVQEGDVIDVRIVCDEGESSTMDVSAAVLDMDFFWKGYEILSASTLGLTTFENTFLEGIIRCDRDGLLYTSIPQNGNWKVSVDGQMTQPVLVGDCMLAVELTEGDHLVSFTYSNKAFTYGLMITIACTLVFADLVWVEWKRKKQA